MFLKCMRLSNILKGDKIEKMFKLMPGHFIVSFGEREKNLRLSAKTLVQFPNRVNRAQRFTVKTCFKPLNGGP